MSRAPTAAAPAPDAKKLFVTIQNIDAISHDYAEQIQALVTAARALVRCDADSLLALDGLLDLIDDRTDLWVTSIESDAEALGAHERRAAHLDLMGRLCDEQSALRMSGKAKEGGAA